MDNATVLTPTRRDGEEVNVIEPANGKQFRQRRWIDLGLVLLVAFVPSIATSVYHFFYPVSRNYTNAQVALGLLHELTALTLFAVLFSRQTRRFGELGLSFKWTDLPKGLYLVIGCFLAAFLTSYALRSIWFLVTHNHLPVATRSTFTASPLLLIPFLILIPFFEEILVRAI
jgi:membrane protease YdiL (CAAX protease family)